MNLISPLYADIYESDVERIVKAACDPIQQQLYQVQRELQTNRELLQLLVDSNPGILKNQINLVKNQIASAKKVADSIYEMLLSKYPQINSFDGVFADLKDKPSASRKERVDIVREKILKNYLQDSAKARQELIAANRTLKFLTDAKDPNFKKLHPQSTWQETYLLTPEKMKALLEIANNETRYAERKKQLEDQIAEIKKQEEASQNYAELSSLTEKYLSSEKEIHKLEQQKLTLESNLQTLETGQPVLEKP
ncbi:MAG: hypothetical protein JWQ35_1228 [Bacteriovoracaceae bacterium]|nr:hypothetical protein [Bacteriovoracaceae bacterium]